MHEILPGVAATAFLVNHSRALQPGLSLDRYARHWIPSSGRGAVEELWRDYASHVYPDDDVVVSVRGRAVVEHLRAALAAAPDLVLLNIGAGFTSYPWLLPIRHTIEVDRPDVVAAKRRRIEVLQQQGVLPARQVRHCGVDLADVAAARQIADAVATYAPRHSPVGVVIEGVLFYLPEVAVHGLLALPQLLGRPVVASAVSYWPASAVGHPVLVSQARWFQQRGVPPESTFLAHDALVAALGPSAQLLDPADQQAAAGVEPMLPEAVIVPEHLATVLS